MNVFDIVGPVMIGPSSSHTAGASRAGLVSRRLLGQVPVRARITLFGSFALTYAGHGADRAIVGGILGFELDDVRLRDSFRYAREMGLDFHFEISDEEADHPNTVVIELDGAEGAHTSVTVQSVGAGVVHVVNIDGADVLFSAEYDTTVVFNSDKPGTVARVSAAFAEHRINIAFMRVFRKQEGKDAIMVIESDQKICDEVILRLQHIPDVHKVITVEPFKL